MSCKINLVEAINSIKNFNDFVTLCHEVSGKNEFPEIPLNISTALALKKIQSFEIKLFTKFQESGLAFKILDHILKLPPSETWRLLTKELASIFCYWLEGLRKYLIIHCQNWWIFLESLLKFINELGQRDNPGSNAVNTWLVKVLADPLLSLATNDKMDLCQRLAVIRCLNYCSSCCKRTMREELADKFSGYFIKIARNMATCDHVPTQLASIELLLRWFLQRKERGARLAVAQRWFSPALWTPSAIALFVESSFDCYGHARAFLNAQNEKSDNVTSVICRKITIGPLTVVTGAETFSTWCDVSSSHGCVSLLLDPRLLKALHEEGGSEEVSKFHETLTVTAEITLAAELYRESTGAVVSLQTSRAPEVLFPRTAQLIEGLGDVRLHVSTRSDLGRLDRALRRAFAGKYRCLLDVDKGVESISQSPHYDPEVSKRFSTSEDDTRLSATFDIARKRKRKASGSIVARRQVSRWNSPSTASTTSLLQLPEKLALLAPLRYETLPSVCARPELSLVAELSEPEDTGATQRRSRAFGVRSLGRVKAKTSPSDSDDITVYRYISPEEIDHEPSHCLLSTTFHDTSAAADSLDRSGVIDTPSLVKETILNSPPKVNFVPETETLTQVEAYSEIENTPYQPVSRKLTSPSKISKCTIVSKSTSDESNNEHIVTEVRPFAPVNRALKRIETSDDSYVENISETPRNYVSVRRKNLKSKNTKENAEAIKRASDIDIEEFFSQHFRESEAGNLIISPTLARKINLSSSDGDSDSFDKDLNSDKVPGNECEVNPTDIVDCLANIIDTVCQDINNCNELMTEQDAALDAIQEDNAETIDDNKAKQKPVRKVKGTPKIKLTFKTPVAKNTSKRMSKKVKGNVPSSPVKKFAALTENDSNDKEYHVVQENITEKIQDEMPLLLRRKRKLYSPKDTIEKDVIHITATEQDDDNPLTELKAKSNLNTPTPKPMAKTAPKSAATSYKDIEDERRKFTKTIRNRKSKSTSPVLSPRTLKNNSLFDKLKVNIENRDLKIFDEKSTNADIAIYNYTSDSEDEDFKKKIFDIRRSLTTLCSNDSTTSKGRVLLSKANYFESSTEQGKAKKPRKRAPKQQPIKKRDKTAKQQFVVLTELVDERMRHTNQKDLDTSLFTEQNAGKRRRIAIEVEPLMNCAQEMELLDEDLLDEHLTDIQYHSGTNELYGENAKKNEVVERNIARKDDGEIATKKASKKMKDLSLRKGGRDTKRNYTKLTEETSEESPLPALIVEKTVPQPDDARSTTSSNLIKKCNRLKNRIENGYEFFDETVATQNMLSDDDKINYSPEIHDYPVEIQLCDELNVSINKEAKKVKRKPSADAQIRECHVEIEIPTPADEIQQYPVEIDLSAKSDVSKRKEAKKDKSKPESVTGEAIGELTHDASIELAAERLLEKKGKQKRKRLTEKTEDLTNKYCAAGESKPKKLKTLKKKPEASKIETIETTSNYSDAPEVSIETDGTSPIRCISDKAPPSSYELNEQFEPRNMELEALSISMQEYFLKLITATSDAAENTPRNPKHTGTKPLEVAQSVAEGSRSSPVVSIKRMSYDDFRKWLPSPKLSSAEDSPDDIIDSPKNIGKHKSSGIKTVRATKELRKTSGKIVTTAKVTKGKAAKKVAEDMIQTPPLIPLEDTSTKHNPKEKVEKRHFIISPIRLNEGDDNIDEEILTTAPEEMPYYFQKPTEIFCQTKTTTKKYLLRSDTNSSNKTAADTKKSSKTYKTPTRRSRKRGLSPQTSPSKWRKGEKGDKIEAVSLAASGATVSSVRAWLTRGSPEKSTAQDEHFAIRECMENVLEKMDTTLIEIHESTSKLFVNMIVEMEARLKEAARKRAEILTRVIEGFKQNDAEIRAEYRRIAAVIVREDCQKKQAMVAILREDIQAAMDHLTTKRSTQEGSQV